MKKLVIIAAIFAYSLTTLTAQDNAVNKYPMIGETAPSFTGESTNGTVNFPSDYPLQWKILFSHPADFTPVCTSELLELADLQTDMKKLKTNLVILSVDNLETHRQWVKSMENLHYKNRITEKITFPLVSDENLNISKKYAMLYEESNSSKNVRGVFIVDPNDKIRAIFFYPMNVGRNMDEILRTLTALQMADKKGVMTPANWEPGGDVLLPFEQDGNASAGTNNPDHYQVAWYMNFKKGEKNLKNIE